MPIRALARMEKRNLRPGMASLILAMVVLHTFCCPRAWAQKDGKVGRTVVSRVKPEYPLALQRVQVGGVVRLSATVSPNGNVLKVQIRGGNPILAESAVTAVMKWKYASGSAETTEEVSLSFSPR